MSEIMNKVRGSTVETKKMEAAPSHVDGFFNVDKPVGVTSQTVDRIVRRNLNVKRVGHAGTLDPFASGVLPVAVGRATKFIDLLPTDKSYRATILFGRATDSADPDGSTVARLDNFTMPTVEQLNSVLRAFVGTIEQTPPKFSAVKLNGRKAYDLARRNVDFDIPTRTVTVNHIELTSIDNNTITLEIDCQRGTYIRSLAVDIGRALELPSMLIELRRTRSGGFNINRSITIENIRAESIIKVEDCLPHLPSINLEPHRRAAFLNALTTNVQNRSDTPLVKVMCQNVFLGTGTIINRELKAKNLLVLQ